MIESFMELGKDQARESDKEAGTDLLGIGRHATVGNRTTSRYIFMLFGNSGFKRGMTR